MYSRALKYAATQARLRARIGQMPGSLEWRHVSVDYSGHVLDGLNDIGVDFWLKGLPREFSISALERHFNGRIRYLLKNISQWLPKQWCSFRDCLVLAPDIFWIGPVLAGQSPGAILDKDSALHSIVQAAPGQRRQLLETTSFSPFLGQSDSPEHLWQQHLRTHVPIQRGVEGRAVDRVLRIVDTYLGSKKVMYSRIAANTDSASEPYDPGTVAEAGRWQLHENLQIALRGSLAGDPFQSALILTYLMLELLVMEKLRALLIGRLMGWKHATVFQETG